MQVNASFHHKDRENLPPLSGAAPSWWEEHRIGTGSPTGWHPRTYDPGVGTHGQQNESVSTHKETLLLRCFVSGLDVQYDWWLTVWLMPPSRYRPKTKPAQTSHSSTKYITVQALNTVWALGTRLLILVMLPPILLIVPFWHVSNWFWSTYNDVSSTQVPPLVHWLYQHLNTA